MAEESTPEGKATDLGQFQSTDDLLKSYKEIQAAFTRVSQENKSLKETANPDRLQQLEAELEEARTQLLARESQMTPSQQRSFDESWMESPEATIDQRILNTFNAVRINDALEEEREKSPEEYAERYAAADILARDPKYAGLVRTPAGIKRLFSEADKLRAGNLQKSLRKSLELLNNGEPLDDEQLANARKILFGKTKNKQNTDAYMPDGSTSTRSAADDESGTRKAKMNAAVEKGDVDGVLGNLFKDILGA